MRTNKLISPDFQKDRKNKKSKTEFKKKTKINKKVFKTTKKDWKEKEFHLKIRVVQNKTKKTVYQESIFLLFMEKMTPTKIVHSLSVSRTVVETLKTIGEI